MKLRQREARVLVRQGMVVPYYSFIFDAIAPDRQKRLLNMLKAGVCTNVGRLEPAYAALAEYANVPAMSIHKAQRFSWTVWVARPPAGFAEAMKELHTVDMTAFRLIQKKVMTEYPDWAQYDPTTGRCRVLCMKGTDVFRRIAAEQWAGTPEYKKAIGDLIELLRSGEPIWFN